MLLSSIAGSVAVWRKLTTALSNPKAWKIAARVNIWWGASRFSVVSRAAEANLT